MPNIPDVQCYMLEDLRKARYYLRRYAVEGKCTGKLSYHDARSPVFAEIDEDPTKPYTGTNPPPEPGHDDPRWPTKCECGYIFKDTDNWQIFPDGLYRHAVTGQILTWEDAPPGAVRDATWWPDKGEDGHAWVIKLPDGGDWMTEQHANNCGCRNATALDPKHRCWQRSGKVPCLTVSPSIQTPHWHGFLRNGVLQTC